MNEKMSTRLRVAAGALLLSFALAAPAAAQTPPASRAPLPPLLECGGPNNPWGFTACKPTYVQLYTGSFDYQQTDWLAPAPGPGLLFRRTYNSDDTRSLA